MDLNSSTDKNGSHNDDVSKYYRATPLAQALLEKHDIPFVGLQYVVEVQQSGKADLESNYYVCALCSKKMSSKTLVAHISCVPHRLKFTEHHCPKLHSNYGAIQIKQWTAALVKEFSAEMQIVASNMGTFQMAVCEKQEKNPLLTTIKENIGNVDKFRSYMNSSKPATAGHSSKSAKIEPAGGASRSAGLPDFLRQKLKQGLKRDSPQQESCIVTPGTRGRSPSVVDLDSPSPKRSKRSDMGRSRSPHSRRSSRSPVRSEDGKPKEIWTRLEPRTLPSGLAGRLGPRLGNSSSGLRSTLVPSGSVHSKQKLRPDSTSKKTLPPHLHSLIPDAVTNDEEFEEEPVDHFPHRQSRSRHPIARTERFDSRRGFSPAPFDVVPRRELSPGPVVNRFRREEFISKGASRRGYSSEMPIDHPVRELSPRFSTDGVQQQFDPEFDNLSPKRESHRGPSKFSISPKELSQVYIPEFGAPSRNPPTWKASSEDRKSFSLGLLEKELTRREVASPISPSYGPLNDPSRNPGLSPLCRDRRSISPGRHDRRSISPVRHDRRSISPLRRDRRSISPLRHDRRIISPLRRDRQSISPLRRDRGSIAPFHRLRRSISPLRRDRRSISPLRRDRRSISPLRRDRRSISPFHRHRRSISPLRRDRRSISPLRRDRRSISPLRRDRRSISPLRRDRRSISPFRRDRRSISPLRRDRRSISPLRRDRRNISPGYQRSISPGHRNYRRISPDHRSAQGRRSITPDGRQRRSNNRRSVSPDRGRRSVSKRSRSRSDSPYTVFKKQDELLIEHMDRMTKYFKKYPSTHPEYTEEWTKFYKRRRQELLQQKIVITDYNLTPEWNVAWAAKVDDLAKAHLILERKGLREKHGLIDEEPVAPKSVEIATTNFDQTKKIMQFIVTAAATANKPKEKDVVNTQETASISTGFKFTVISTLKLLNELESHLGELGTSISSLLYTAVNANIVKSDPLSIFKDVANLSLVESAMQKIVRAMMNPNRDSDLDSSGSVCIQSVKWLLNEVYWEHFAGVDIIQIVSETRNCSFDVFAQKIAKQLLKTSGQKTNADTFHSILESVTKLHELRPPDNTMESIMKAVTLGSVFSDIKFSEANSSFLSQTTNPPLQTSSALPPSQGSSLYSLPSTSFLSRPPPSLPPLNKPLPSSMPPQTSFPPPSFPPPRPFPPPGPAPHIGSVPPPGPAPHIGSVPPPVPAPHIGSVPPPGHASHIGSVPPPVHAPHIKSVPPPSFPPPRPFPPPGPAPYIASVPQPGPAPYIASVPPPGPAPHIGSVPPPTHVPQL